MKIEKVAFKNINSLRGEHRIDFTQAPFNSQALFAITGATGSGKTTILDVITLALYNRIPRLGKVSKSEIDQNGFVLTRGEKDAYARVTYQTNHGQFTSEWKIETNRNNKLKEYEMSVLHTQTGEYLTDKKTEVITKNEELIGLNYEQFSKSALLAQGEFSKFLNAKKNERSALLEKIIGTEIYRSIGIRAYDKSRKVNQQISDLQKIKLDRQNEMVDEESLKQFITSKTTTEKELKTFEVASKKLEKQVEQKKVIENLIGEIDKLENLIKDNTNRLKAFEKNEGLALKNHELVAPFSENLNKLTRITNEEKELSIQHKAIENQHATITKSKDEIVAEIHKLIGQKIDEPNFIEALNTFEQSVEALESELNTLLIGYASQTKEANIYLANVGLVLNAKNTSDIQEKLSTISDKAKAHLLVHKNTFSQKEINEIQNTRKRLNKEIELIQEANREAIIIQNIRNEIDKTQQTKKLIEGEIKTLPNAIDALSKEVQIEEGKAHKLENILLKASLEEHRKNLVEGEECPLCGATHHPFAEHTTEAESSIQKQFDAQKIVVKELNKKLATLKEQQLQKKKGIAQIEGELEKLNTQAETTQKSFASKYAYPLTTDWTKEIQVLKTKNESLNTVEIAAKNIEIAERVNPILEALRNLTEKGTKLREEKKKLYNSETPIHQAVTLLQKKWTTIDKEKSTIAERLSAVNESISSHKKTIESLNSSLLLQFSTANIVSIDWAKNALLSLEKTQSIRSQKNQLITEKERLGGQFKAMNDQLATLKKDEEQVDLIKLQEEQNEISQKIIHHTETLDQLKLSISKQQEIQERIQSIDKELEVLMADNKYWFMLSKLIGDSTGNKFNAFAQQLTLKQLLVLANKRLQFLNNRYVIDSPAEGEDESLTIIDADMGGLRRTVNTLSGGETFMISLALALALSDLASKNVQINSLFIDEGFGTLDTETLDQTLDTLERLQQEGDKLIGIISHVQSLKERISTQIVVTQNGRGFSQLDIVG